LREWTGFEMLGWVGSIAQEAAEAAVREDAGEVV